MRMWNWVRRQRIASISTPFGGFQLSQQPDTSFEHAQDERELMDEIWLQAGIEAYGAKDAARRMEQLVGKTRFEVLDLYFAENPEIKRWVDRNIEAGTCRRAVTELREKREERRERREQQLRTVQPLPVGPSATEILRELGLSPNGTPMRRE